ncbi:MAG: cobalamin biosynthesis protein CobQ [Pseudomonadota bacterium]
MGFLQAVYTLVIWMAGVGQRVDSDREAAQGRDGMNSITHLVAAAALLARKDEPQRNLAVAAGAFLPDASIYVFFAWSRMEGLSMRETWDVAYWSEPWQTLGAISNSVPLELVLLALGLWRGWPAVSAFAGAALIHAALDFPLHADDAHRHAWPLTDWRFHSPVSYWDNRHMGWLGASIEGATVLGSVALLLRRFRGPLLRASLLIFACLMVAAAAWSVAGGG